jgi:hypothetical protein
MMQRTTRGAISIICILPLVSGCGLFQSVNDKVQNVKSAIGDVSYVDRCFDFMRRAAPNARFEMTDKSVNSTIDSDTVTILANRNDATPAYGVSVQCRFDHGMIVDFHWLKGPLS